MKNSIIFVNDKNAMEQISFFERSNYLVVTLRGDKIKTRNDFFSAMEEALSFPGKCEGLFSRFDDWITDLGWINKETGICIVINSFSKFLSIDTEFKMMVLEDFEEDILPFWESEVVNIVKEGTPRGFAVILVD